MPLYRDVIQDTMMGSSLVATTFFDIDFHVIIPWMPLIAPCMIHKISLQETEKKQKFPARG